VVTIILLPYSIPSKSEIKMLQKVNELLSKIQGDIAKDPSYRDLTFQCDGQTLSYHQAIIIPISPMLEAILQGGELCHPSLPINNVTIILDNISQESVRVLMEMLYTGQSIVGLSEDYSDIEQLIDMLGLEVEFKVEKYETNNLEKLVDDKRPGATAPKRSRSRAWDFFSLLDDNSVTCSICQKVIKRSVGSGNTHGMLRHLRTYHADTFNEEKKEEVMNVKLEDVQKARNEGVKEFQLKTSDLKEFASKLESMTAKAPAKQLVSKPSKPPPRELYPTNHYIWTYYTPRPDGKANCETCYRDISRSFSGKNDFMVSHMSHFHPEVYTQYVTKKARLGIQQQIQEYANIPSNESEIQSLEVSPPGSPDMIEDQSPVKSPVLDERKRVFHDTEQPKYSKKKKITPKDSNEEGTEMEQLFLQRLKRDMNELGDELRFQSGKKKTSLIWNFFSEADYEGGKDVNAKCDLCSAEIARPHGTTTKLSGHLRKHKLLFKEFKRLDSLRKLQNTSDDVLRETELNNSEESFTID